MNKPVLMTAFLFDAAAGGATIALFSSHRTNIALPIRHLAELNAAPEFLHLATAPSVNALRFTIYNGGHNA